VLVVAGIDDPKLDGTASHPSSSSHSLPHRVCQAPCVDDYGWSGSTASVYMLPLLLLSLSIGRQTVSATFTAVSHQFWPWFRLRP